MKLLPKLALALSLAFGLSACDDGEITYRKDETMPFGGPIPEVVTPEIIAAVSKAPAPPRAYPAHDPVNEDRFLRMTFTIATHDSRALRVTAAAYCEKYDALPEPEYQARCGQYVKLMLDFIASEYGCFEGAVPATGAAVRNHPDLAGREGCFSRYPETYSSFSETMMRTALELTEFDQNLYTVLQIEPLPKP